MWGLAVPPNLYERYLKNSISFFIALDMIEYIRIIMLKDKEGNVLKKVYLDSASTYLKNWKIIKEVIGELEEIDANPHSNHTMGKTIKGKIEKVRKQIAEYINCNYEDIFFVSGGTEGNNMVFNYIFNKYASRIANGEIFDILTSNMEHESVLSSLERLKKSGFNIIYVETDKYGRVDIEDLKKKLSSKTVLVSIMAANNETGVMNDIRKIGEIISQYNNLELKDSEDNILFHSDCVQVFGKKKIDIEEMKLDYITVSFHKMGGLNSSGIIYARDKKMIPILLGGNQESGMKSGTVDALAVIVAGRILEDIIGNDVHTKVKGLRKYLETKLKESKIEYEINCNDGLKEDEYLDEITSIYLKNIDIQSAITILDVNGIYISGGSACSSGNILHSKIIEKIYDEERAKHSIRIGIGGYNTFEDIDRIVESLEKIEERRTNNK
jgi:cysteine desulfurase nifS